MKATLLIAALSVAGCDTLAKHPLAIGAIVGGSMMAGGIALAEDHHPLVGGSLIGASIGSFMISIPIGIIIDDYNAAHSGPR